MGIFYRRPLCLFCCLFLVGSLVAWFSPSLTIPWILGVLAFAIAVLFCLLFFFRRYRIRILTVALCVISVFCSVGFSYLTIDLPQARAWRWLGEHEVELVITEVLSESEYSARCKGTLICVDGEKMNCSVISEYAYGASLAIGDRVVGRADVERTVASDTAHLVRNRDGTLLSVSFGEDEPAYVRRNSELDWRTLLQSESGWTVVFARLRAFLHGRLQSFLGDELGALSDAFLFGNTSPLSPSVVRNFRRAGVSHMMAVSGLHISILLGSIDLFLRKLFVPKKLRCVIITLLAALFLLLTGLSLSACRSVLMLWAVYLSFLSERDSDTLTALFVSIVVILLLIPYSVADLGMWMSFLATLGLVTVYPLCESHLPKAKRLPMRLLRMILGIVCMTVIANLFLLPVLWIFFGEISLIAVLANVILMPFSYVLLIGTPLVLILGGIPFLGEWVSAALFYSGRCLLFLVEWFASLPDATLSLRYDFCRVLIPLFAAVSLVLLIVRLHRHRWLLSLPPLLMVLSFAICLGIVWYRMPALTVTYANDGARNEYFLLEERDSIVICDISRGGWSARQSIQALYFDANATEIEAFVLTHYHTGHLTTLDSLTGRWFVRTVYLPMPRTREELELADALEKVVSEQGSHVIFYEDGTILTLTRHISMRAEFLDEVDGSHPSFALSFAGEREVLTYLSSNLLPSDACLKEHQYLFFGSHGKRAKEAEEVLLPEASKLTAIVYTSHSLPIHEGMVTDRIPVYRPTEEQKAYSFSFLLS